MNEHMNKKSNPFVNFVKAFVFCSLFLVMFILVSYTLRQYEGSASRKNICGYYAEEKESLDLVCVGGSSIFDFWEPMEFWKEYGLTSYNFATGAIPPQFYIYALKEIQKDQSPQLYIIDLRPFTVAERVYNKEENMKNMDTDSSIRNFTDNLKYSLNRFEAIKNGVKNGKDILPYYLDIGMYHTRWPKLLDSQSRAYALNEEKDPTKGFKLVESVKKVKFDDFSDIEERGKLSQRIEGILIELLDYCKEQDLQVLFLVNHYCQSKSQKKAYNTMSDLIAEYGYETLNTNDYCDEIGMDFTTDYFDGSHTNILGADKYCAFLFPYIIEHYKLIHTANEKVDAAWDTDYAIWKEKKEETKTVILEMIQEQK